jgi:hypothetical protein
MGTCGFAEIATVAGLEAAGDVAGRSAA